MFFILQVILTALCGMAINYMKENWSMDDSFFGHVGWVICIVFRIVFWVMIGKLTFHLLFGIIFF